MVFGKSGGVPGYRTLVVGTEDGGRVLALSLTTTGNGDGSEDERLLGIAARRPSGWPGVRATRQGLPELRGPPGPRFQPAVHAWSRTAWTEPPGAHRPSDR